MSGPRIVWRNITKIPPHPDNAKAHDLDFIRESIRRFGFRAPIILSPNGPTSEGHGRTAALVAMRQAGEEPPEGIRGHGGRPAKIGGAWFAPCVEGLPPFASAADERAFLVASNRAVERGGWDDAKLVEVLQGFPEPDPTGFGQVDFDRLLARVNPPPGRDSDGDGGEEAPDAPTPEPRVGPGEAWLCGPHVVLCGDFRQEAVLGQIQDLAPSGVNVAITSPPYAQQRKYDEESGFRPIPPDEYREWFRLVQHHVREALAPDGSWFLNIKEHCEDGQRVLYVKDLVLAHVREWGWMFVDEYAWVHGGTPRAVVRRFKNGWEPVFHFAAGEHKFRPDTVRHATDAAVVDWSGAHPSQQDGLRMTSGVNARLQGSAAGGKEIHDAVASSATGLAYPSNVLRVGKNREALGHGAAFPVELPRFFIRAFTDPGDWVLDPFAGSGSTMMAAEQEDRPSVSVEISPGYCDIMIDRWERATGGIATLEGR